MLIFKEEDGRNAVVKVLVVISGWSWAQDTIIYLSKSEWITLSSALEIHTYKHQSAQKKVKILCHIFYQLSPLKPCLKRIHALSWFVVDLFWPERCLQAFILWTKEEYSPTFGNVVFCLGLDPTEKIPSHWEGRLFNKAKKLDYCYDFLFFIFL